MTLSVDLYFSFRSPYSYLATYKVQAMRIVWDVEVNLRPVRQRLVRPSQNFLQMSLGFFEFMFLESAYSKFVTLHGLRVMWIFSHLLLGNQLRCHSTPVRKILKNVIT